MSAVSQDDGRSAVSRRGLLAAAGAVGVAATAATVVGVTVTSAGAKPAARADSPKTEANAADGALVVHVRDAAAGTLDVFTGTEYRQVRDPDLAARLTAAARTES